jgi:hypothetical protein
MASLVQQKYIRTHRVITEGEKKPLIAVVGVVGLKIVDKGLSSCSCRIGRRSGCSRDRHRQDLLLSCCSRRFHIIL